jgi:O-antigen/teichoic acid export membrane protein
MNWDAIQNWFLGLGAEYGVNPLIFGSIYVGAIPFFSFCIGWLIRNYRQGRSIILPAMLAMFFFLSAYLYLIFAGKNVPAWVYIAVILMIVIGVISTLRKIRRGIARPEN